MQSRPPERFEDLPIELQDELLRAPAQQVDARRVRVRARRSLGHAIAAAVLLVPPGAWFVSVFVAPMAILNASLALLEARGVPELRTERGWAIAGLAVSTSVLVLILVHVIRLAILASAIEELLRLP